MERNVYKSFPLFLRKKSGFYKNICLPSCLSEALSSIKHEKIFGFTKPNIQFQRLLGFASLVGLVFKFLVKAVLI